MLEIPRGPWHAGRQSGSPDFGTSRHERRVFADSLLFRMRAPYSRPRPDTRRPAEPDGRLGFSGFRERPTKRAPIWEASFWGHCFQIAPGFLRLSYDSNAPRIISLSRQEFAPFPHKRAGGASRVFANFRTAYEGWRIFLGFRELPHRLVFDQGCLFLGKSPPAPQCPGCVSPGRPAIRPAPHITSDASRGRTRSMTGLLEISRMRKTGRPPIQTPYSRTFRVAAPRFAALRTSRATRLLISRRGLPAQNSLRN